MTSGTELDAYGYSHAGSRGTMSDRTIVLPGRIAELTVVGAWVRHGGDTDGAMVMTIESSDVFELVYLRNLNLYVCDKELTFTLGSRIVPTFAWDDADLDWSTTQTRTLYIARDDTAAPVLQSTIVNGSTATLSFNESLDGSSVPGPGAFVIRSERGAEDIAHETSNVDISEGRVVVTFSPAVRYGNVPEVTYTPGTDTLKDLSSNEVEGFTKDTTDPIASGGVQNLTPQGPAIERIRFTGPAKTYGIGEVIEVEAIFNEAVRVTGRPQVALAIGDETRQARWTTGQAPGARQRFAYTVVEGDFDPDGAGIESNGLTLPPGASILTEDDNETVLIDHAGLTEPARRVDGVRPLAVSAEAAGATVTVTYDEALDEGSVPSGAGGFRVTIGEASGPAVTSVAVAGETVRLALADALAAGTTGVTVTYAPPPADPIRDAAGNAALRFAAALPVTVAPDVTKPVLETGADAVVAYGDLLVLTFNEPLDEASAPAPSAFSVAIARGGTSIAGYTVSAVTVEERKVRIALSQGLRAGDTVTLTYTVPADHPIRDIGGNAGISFTRSADNRTGAPTLGFAKSTATEGTDRTITVAVSANGTQFGTDQTFTITAEGGSSAIEVEDWTLASATVTLPTGKTEQTLSMTIVDDDEARIHARGEAVEGEEYKFSVMRSDDQSTDRNEETHYVLMGITDSAFPDVQPLGHHDDNGPGGRAVTFEYDVLEGYRSNSEDRPSVKPPDDSATPEERTMTLTLQATHVTLKNGADELVHRIYIPYSVDGVFEVVTVPVRESGTARAGAAPAIVGTPAVSAP